MTFFKPLSIGALINRVLAAKSHLAVGGILCLNRAKSIQQLCGAHCS